LTAETLLSDALGSLGFGTLELVEAPSNRLPVDAELASEVDLLLARTNTPADPLHVRIRQLGPRCHTTNLSSVGTFRGTYGVVG
jgi:hypothetical protein